VLSSHLNSLTTFLYDIHSEEVYSKSKNIFSPGILSYVSETYQSRLFARVPKLKNIYKRYTSKKNKNQDYLCQQFCTFVKNFSSFSYKQIIDSKKIIDKNLEAFLCSTMHFLAFLESTLIYRRFTHSLLVDNDLISLAIQLCTLSYCNSQSFLSKYIECFLHFVRYPIDEFSGEIITKIEQEEALIKSISEMQLFVFTTFIRNDPEADSKLKNFSLCAPATLLNHDSLRKNLLDLEESIFEKVFDQFKLFDLSNNFSKYTKLDHLVAHFTDTKRFHNDSDILFVHPNEELVWSCVFDSDERQEASSLMMPIHRLNYQYLSLKDYFYRNFILLLMNSACIC
ncbi:MAG: hypothetical protein MHPSP_002429, partial [Paramarteilia canceri]